MNTKEDFLFGDISSLDLKNCEDISITESLPAPTRQLISPVATSVKVIATPKELISKSLSISSADPNAILTVKQAAKYLQIRSETILRKIYSGELSAFKVGRIWRIKQAQIEEYLNKNLSDIK